METQTDLKQWYSAHLQRSLSRTVGSLTYFLYLTINVNIKVNTFCCAYC